MHSNPADTWSTQLWSFAWLLEAASPKLDGRGPVRMPSRL
jgi:hypothetical protein